MTLKEQFLTAVIAGDLGTKESMGIIVTAQEFKQYFDQIKTDYINSFLPASVIEPGRTYMTHTRFLFRVARGRYMVHPDAIQEYREKQSAMRASDGWGRVEEMQLVYCA